ncbi:MAG: wecD [Polaromonas sp.]|nr:wecD [Polaromonas sp.]
MFSLGGDGRSARLAGVLQRGNQMLRIVALTAHPELVPIIAEWLHAEFDHARGPSLKKRIAQLRAQKSPEETFVLFDDDVPVGTASLVINDLPSRPELTPWLASVLVRSEYRGRGYSAPLVKHVEMAAATMSRILWLYTWTAEPLYTRLGWKSVGPERDNDRDIAVVLMNRDLR